MTGQDSSWKQEKIFHSGVSVSARLAHMLGPVTLKPVLAHAPLIAPVLLSLRAMDVAVGLIPAPKRLEKQVVKTSTWSAHYFESREKSSPHAIVYFHGGAFLSCGLGTHRRIVEALATATGASTLTVAYRQHPEAAFEESVRDATEAVEWLMEQGYSAEQIVLVGDSAGGGLAMRVAGDFLAQGQSMAAVVALSGWLDFDSTPKQTHHWTKQDAYIPSNRLQEVANLILGHEPTLEDSPLYELREGFPPLLLICGATEILRMDTEKAYKLAKLHSIPCEVHYFRGGVHAFPVALDLFPEAREALSVITRFVKRLPAAAQASDVA